MLPVFFEKTQYKGFYFLHIYSIMYMAFFNLPYYRVTPEAGFLAKKEKKRRTRKIRSINVGIFIIALFCIYVIVNMILGLTKDHLSIYEVQAISMSKDNSATAVIIRNEENYYTDRAGYTNFYVRSGARVAVGDTVYSIDEGKNIYDYLTDYDISYTLSENDAKSLKSYISDFNDDYSGSDFAPVYELRGELESEMLNISDSYLLENLESIMGEGEALNFDVIKTQKAGVISFFSDTLDGIDADTVTVQTFDMSGYDSKNLYDSELKESNSLVYKIVDDSNWTLIINLSREQYEQLCEQSTISFTVKQDGLKLTQPCTYFTRGDGYFARIDMQNYLIRYIKERFLELELVLDDEEGLKIPYSSLVEKEFYVIPSQYYYHYADEDLYGFTYMNYDQATNTKTFQFKECNCYYEDTVEGVVYVDTADFAYGQYVYCMEDESLYQVSVIKKLEGVYNVNEGFAVFRRIEMLSQNDDYCIVRKGASKSLRQNDHIVLNADLIDENVQIY